MKRFMNGWNISRFIISPAETKQALSGYHHVNFQSRVSADYVESEPHSFFAGYQSFYEKLANGYAFEWKRDWQYFGWHTGITNDLLKCAYGAPFRDEKDKQMYKTSAFSEPCVGIGPFALYISGDKKLHTNYSYTQFPQFTVGIQIEYPKLFIKGEDGQITEAVTDTFGVYETICKRIKGISKGLTFTALEKTYRANVKIGTHAKNDFMNFNFATHFGCNWP